MADEGSTSIEDIQDRVNALGWFHDWTLVPGVRTKGISNMAERAPYFAIPEDLSGKRVLDIGCADGFFTFLAEARGAEVVAIDSWPRQSFFLAREVLGSRAEFHHASVYDLRPETFGFFDIVFLFGVYYHLKHPILALERIAGVTREWALVESQITVDHAKPSTRVKRLLWQQFRRPRPSAPEVQVDAVNIFLEHDELNQDPTNWWVPNIACLMQTIRAAGFPRTELVCCYHGNRGIVRAIKGPRTAAKPLAEDIWIVIDVPSAGAKIQGPMLVEGWALSQLHPEDGIESVHLYLDNLDDPKSELGEAEYGLWRPDQTFHFGDRYGACGYRFHWDPTGAAVGSHTLYILVEGTLGWNYRPVSVVVG